MTELPDPSKNCSADGYTSSFRIYNTTQSWLPGPQFPNSFLYSKLSDADARESWDLARAQMAGNSLIGWMVFDYRTGPVTPQPLAKTLFRFRDFRLYCRPRCKCVC